MEKTIKSEKKTFHQKRFFELIGIFILLIVAVMLLCSGAVLNPFRIKEIKEEADIIAAYEEDVNYVKMTGQNLDFTGYYRMDHNGDITYNCYVTTDYDTKFFVFLPVGRTVDKDGNTQETITDYDLVGRIKRDEQLIETVAADYEVTLEDFMKECSVSGIVIDEAGAKRKEVLIIWVALFTLLSLYCIYVLVVLFGNRNMGGKQDGENQA